MTARRRSTGSGAPPLGRARRRRSRDARRGDRRIARRVGDGVTGAGSAVRPGRWMARPAARRRRLRPRASDGRQPARRRSWPDRSRPTRTSPNSRSIAGRLAAGSQRLDHRLRDGRRGLGRRERTLVEALRRREQPAPRDHVRVAGTARDRRQPDVGSRARPGRHGRAGRHELDHPGAGIVGIREPGDRRRGSRPRRRRWPPRPAPPSRRRRAGPRGRRAPSTARPPPATGRSRPPATTTARAATCRRARRWAASPRPRGRGSSAVPW